jgi:hypothetical protein
MSVSTEKSHLSRIRVPTIYCIREGKLQLKLIMGAMAGALWLGE